MLVGYKCNPYKGVFNVHPGTRAPNLVVFVIARGMYPDTWAPHQVVFVMLGHVPGYLGTILVVLIVLGVCIRAAGYYAWLSSCSGYVPG